MADCAACGSALTPKRRHCPQCGTGLAQVAELDAMAAASPPDAPELATEPDAAPEPDDVEDPDGASDAEEADGDAQPARTRGARVLGTVMILVGLGLIGGGAVTAYLTVK